MGTTRVVEAVRRVSVALQDMAPQFRRHAERDIIDAMNDGQVALFTFLPTAGAQVISMRLAPGTQQSIEQIPAAHVKLLDGTAPSEPIRGTQVLDFYADAGADGLTLGFPVNIVPREQLDTSGDNWHARTGPVTRSVVYDPQVPLNFFAVPGVLSSGPQRWLRMAIAAMPKALPNTGEPEAELYGLDSTSTTKISIPDEYLDALVNYTVARRLLTLSDPASQAKAGAFASLFTSFINAKVQSLTGNNPNLKALPLAPAPLAQAS